MSKLNLWNITSKIFTVTMFVRVDLQTFHTCRYMFDLLHTTFRRDVWLQFIISYYHQTKVQRIMFAIIQRLCRFHLTSSLVCHVVISDSCNLSSTALVLHPVFGPFTLPQMVGKAVLKLPPFVHCWICFLRPLAEGNRSKELVARKHLSVTANVPVNRMTRRLVGNKHGRGEKWITLKEMWKGSVHGPSVRGLSIRWMENAQWWVEENDMKGACSARGRHENWMRHFNRIIQGKKPFRIHRCKVSKAIPVPGREDVEGPTLSRQSAQRWR
jgi:hypothetical protein